MYPVEYQRICTEEGTWDLLGLVTSGGVIKSNLLLNKQIPKKKKLWKKTSEENRSKRVSKKVRVVEEPITVITILKMESACKISKIYKNREHKNVQFRSGNTNKLKHLTSRSFKWNSSKDLVKAKKNLSPITSLSVEKFHYQNKNKKKKTFNFLAAIKLCKHYF